MLVQYAYDERGAVLDMSGAAAAAPNAFGGEQHAAERQHAMEVELINRRLKSQHEMDQGKVTGDISRVTRAAVRRWKCRTCV